MSTLKKITRKLEAMSRKEKNVGGLLLVGSGRGGIHADKKHDYSRRKFKRWE